MSGEIRWRSCEGQIVLTWHLSFGKGQGKVRWLSGDQVKVRWWQMIRWRSGEGQVKVRWRSGKCQVKLKISLSRLGSNHKSILSLTLKDVKLVARLHGFCVSGVTFRHEGMGLCYSLLLPMLSHQQSAPSRVRHCTRGAKNKTNFECSLITLLLLLEWLFECLLNALLGSSLNDIFDIWRHLEDCLMTTKKTWW